MLLCRVFPYLDDAGEGEPGHALHVHPVQGGGRWDNPSLYRTCYLATSPEAAIGEAFGNLVTWTPAMLVFPGLPGSQRRLGVYRFDGEANPLIDLDDEPTAKCVATIEKIEGVLAETPLHRGPDRRRGKAAGETRFL